MSLHPGHPHPGHSELFQSARAPRPSGEILAHLDACASCRERFRRFRAGVALMSEAGSLTPEVDWSRMDKLLTTEAEQAARSMRVRPEAPWRSGRGFCAFLSVSGLTLAAAAAGLMLFAPSLHKGSALSTAQHGPRANPLLGSPQTQRPRALAPRHPGASALPSRVIASHGEVSSHADALGDGAVLSTGFDGSATVALNGNWQMELRASSEVELDHVEDPSVVTLRRGQVSVQPSSTESRHELSLHARRWTLSGDGALVARVELNRVRVTVLSGHITTHHGTVVSRYTGPIDLALPDSGDRAEVISHGSSPLMASAQARPGAAPEPQIEAPTPVAPSVMPPTTAPDYDLNTIPSGLREAEHTEQRSLRAQARTVLSTCLRACREQGTCVGPVTLAVLVSPNGQVTHARASGELSPEARTCVEREARTMAISAPSGASAFRFDFAVDE